MKNSSQTKQETSNLAYPRVKFCNRNGEEISETEWVSLLCDAAYSILAQDIVGSMKISTAWLGMIDSNLGKLSLFETLVMSDDDERVLERYATEELAIKGHARIVAKMKHVRET